MFKKGLLTIFTILISMIGINSVDAASISISSNKSSVIVGNTVTFTVTISSGGNIGQAYGSVSASSNLTLQSGSSGTSINYFNGNNEQIRTLTYTYTYKANASGDASITVSGVEIGNLETGAFEAASTTSKTISVVKSGTSSSGSSGGSNNKPAKKYSSDNDLKSLEIEGYELEPKFDKGTLEYKLTLDQSVEMVKVNAKANDDKASVKGTGEVNLSLGENTIEIKVIAENGNEKVYKLIISVEDLHPIEVEVDKKKYTIVKKNNELIELLENFEEIKLNIEEQEVVGYNNPNTNVNLVILKDEDNKLGYYVYNSHDNSYVRYRYININGINLQLLDSNEKLHNFDKYKVTVQEEEIDIYKIKKSHKVGLIYGTNNANGNTGYYVYDKNEETLSKYFDEEISLYKSENEKLRNVIMLLIGSFSLVVIVYVIILLVRSKKKKRKF